MLLVTRDSAWQVLNDMEVAAIASVPQPGSTYRRNIMSNAQIDKLKGKVKETTGTVTGNDKLKLEGQAQQVAAEAKGVIGKVVGKITKLFKG
jgi:uncharacterized protein YjbJ (UPF0337 family)